MKQTKKTKTKKKPHSSLSLQKKHLPNIMIHHYTHTKMAKFKNLTVSGVDENVEQLELLYTTDWDVKIWKAVHQFLVKLSYTYHMTQKFLCRCVAKKSKTIRPQGCLVA